MAALAALRALLDQGTHHLIILSMIVREIRLLLQARILVDSGKLPKFNHHMEYGSFQKNILPVLSGFADTMSMPKDFLTNKHPFVVFNALRNCSRFTYPRLINFLDELLELDRSFKSSASSPQLLLEMFLIRACEKNNVIPHSGYLRNITISFLLSHSAHEPRLQDQCVLLFKLGFILSESHDRFSYRIYPTSCACGINSTNKYYCTTFVIFEFH